MFSDKNMGNLIIMQCLCSDLFSFRWALKGGEGQLILFYLLIGLSFEDRGRSLGTGKLQGGGPCLTQVPLQSSSFTEL